MQSGSRSEGECRLLAEGRALRRLARDLLGNVADAEDLVQSTYAAALGSPRLDATQRPWLRATVRNLALLWRRTAQRRLRRERLAAVAEVDPACDPAAIAMQSELLRDVAAAVHALDEPLRTVVVLRFWHGLLPGAIAQRLGVPRNTVRSRLQRRLQRLRAQLDAQHGDRQRWSAPLAAVLGWRPATGIAGAAAAAFFVGWMMQTKLWLGAGAVVLAAVAIPWTLARAPAPLAPPTPARVPVAAERAPGEVQRQEVAAAPAPAAPVAAPAPPSGPWSTRFLVTDDDDLPVADATVSIWAVPDPDQHGGALRHGKETLLQLQTASDGTARAVVEGAWIAAAAAKGALRTGDSWLSRQRDADQQTVFVLQPSVLQRGKVLRRDGAPAVGAIVRINVQGWSSLQRGQPPEPEPAPTDADGRFAVPLQKFVPYAIDAVLDGERTFRDGFEVKSDPPPDLVLTFPGAITVRGVVVDPAGAQVANAAVRCWREYRLGDPDQDPDDMETCHAETGADGRFAFDLRQHRRYQLIASAAGFASSTAIWIEPTAVHAHPEVRLALLREERLRGIVLREDGSPIADAGVVATAASGPATRANAVPSREAMFGRWQAAKTDADGRFAFSVHPGTKWNLQVRPVRGQSRLCYSWSVAAGDDEVELRLTDAQLRGCRVRGTVERADTGLPVAQFGLRVVDLDDPVENPELPVLPSEHTAGDFELCLPLGRRFALEILPGPGGSPGSHRPDDPALAPLRTEAFTSSGDREFALRVPAWATVPLCVLTADGAPAHHVIASLVTDGMLRPSWKVDRTDRDGRLLLEHRVPGTAVLRLRRGMTKLAERQVVLMPGLNPEITVRLPATGSPR